MKYIFTIFINCLFLIVQAQSNLFYFSVPQSVYVANEDIKFGIASHSEKSLYVYIKIQNTFNSDLVNAYIKASNKLTTASIRLPNDIKAGSYSLSAYILNANGIDVAEYHTYLIHVTDGNFTNYESLASTTENNAFDTKKDIVIKTRSKIGLSSIQPASSYAIVNADYGILHSYYTSILDNKSIDTCFRLFYKLTSGKNDANKLAVLNLNNKFCAKVQDCNNGIISTTFNETKVDNDLVFLDINAIKTFEGLTPYTPAILGLPSRVKIIASDDINKLYKQSADRLKIMQYMSELPSDSTNAQQVKLKADNEYVMGNYEAFETLDLFFKEVVLPYKIDRSNGNFSIILLTGVEKKWNRSKATLIIDGAIVDNHAKLFEMKYEDVVAIRLYRKIETLRNHYGALGRNGVIEVTTKKPANILHFKVPTILPESNNKALPLSESLPNFDTSFFTTSTNPFHNDCIGRFDVYNAMANELLGHYHVD